MTSTKHGWHIPNSPDTDDQVGGNRARCGGVTICKECIAEMVAWTNNYFYGGEAEKAMSGNGMKMGAEANGTGKLTKEGLLGLLRGVPDDATLTINAGNDQRSGDYWSVRASWGGEDPVKVEKLGKNPFVGTIHRSYDQFNNVPQQFDKD